MRTVQGADALVPPIVAATMTPSRGNPAMRPIINPFALLPVFVLSGCVTLSGTYEIKAYDNAGQPILRAHA